MKRIVLFAIALLSLLPMRLKAGEGMWLLSLIKRLNYRDMQREGLQLTPEEIYSVNHSSLKDAVISFNGHCTGEVVSPQGLIFTNHHCGYESVGGLSTPQHNYLKDGFWAHDKSQELRTKSLFVSFFVRMEDVTDRIQKALNEEMSQAQRARTIRRLSNQLIRENNAGGKYRVEVKSFFKGNEFYLFVYQDYRDVRLVGVPPSSIGKFGGDTDNWEWPRHTGDFCIFRVYGDKDGNPAPYAVDNVPLKSKSFLPIDMGGVKPGDFMMTIGYPAVTHRYLTSWGVTQLANVAYPAFVESVKSGLDLIKRYMDKNPKTKIDYASNYSILANAWKNRVEMIKSLIQQHDARKKRRLERRFARWAAKKPQRARYAKTLPMLKDYYTTTDDEAIQRSVILGIVYAGRIVNTASGLTQFLRVYTQRSKKEQKLMRASVQSRLKEIYDHLDMGLESALLKRQIRLYAERVKPELQFTALRQMQKGGTSGIASYIDKALSHSVLRSFKAIDAFLAHPDKAVLDRDAFIALVQSIVKKYSESAHPTGDKAQEALKGNRLFLSGLQKRYPHRKFYPDANRTPRLSYGTVKPLPRDKRNDARKNYYTTLKGTIAKYKPGDPEFDLPPKLIKLYNTKDYGRYAAADGSMHVDFLTDNDISGGNSGSPVIDGRGELAGLAFDGNAEAMSGDVRFEKRLQRTIVTDIRYVLFIIDKYAGATNLIKEMKLVN